MYIRHFEYKSRSGVSARNVYMLCIMLCLANFHEEPLSVCTNMYLFTYLIDVLRRMATLWREETHNASVLLLVSPPNHITLTWGHQYWYFAVTPDRWLTWLPLGPGIHVEQWTLLWNRLRPCVWIGNESKAIPPRSYIFALYWIVPIHCAKCRCMYLT